MEAENLHLLGRGVFGNQLYQHRPRAFGSTVTGVGAGFVKVVDALAGHVDEELQEN